MKRKLLKMSVPKDGWCNLSISYWHDRVSYLTDFPLDLLQSLISLIRDRKISTIYCDAEGWEYYIIFDFYEITIVEKKEKNKLYTFNYDYKLQGEYICKEIKKNITAWINWECIEDKKASEVYKKKLIDLLEELKELLGIEWG